MSISVVHVYVHVRGTCLCPVRGACLCPCCMTKSMLPVHVYAACLCPCCVTKSMLNVQVHAACPGPCFKSMSILYVFVNVHAACPCPCMSMSMLHPHIPLHAACPLSISILLVRVNALRCDSEEDKCLHICKSAVFEHSCLAKSSLLADSNPDPCSKISSCKGG